MTIDPELLEWLEAPERRRIDLGLGRVEKFLARLGNPQKKIPSIIIGGTNGKGTVAATLSAILTGLGVRTGLYTSPHLKNYTERYRRNEREVGEGELTGVLSEIREMGGEDLTTFEILTVAAWMIFQDKVDLAILEVGLGGRLDATNVSHPVVTVVTNVSKDHMEFLGNTLEHIAREKAGILRVGVPIITGVEDPALRKIFTDIDGDDYRITRLGNHHLLGQWMLYAEEGYVMKPFLAPFLGKFQSQNVGLAIRAARETARKLHIEWNEEIVRASISKTHWPGRLQIRLQSNHHLIYDGAHNPAGIRALVDALNELPIRRPLTGIIGLGKLRPANEMIKLLSPILDRIVLVQAPHPDAAAPQHLKRYVPSSLEPLIIRDFADAPPFISKRLSTSSVLVTGSLYLVGALI